MLKQIHPHLYILEGEKGGSLFSLQNRAPGGRKFQINDDINKKR